jgi:hypothetical protein
MDKILTGVVASEGLKLRAQPNMGGIIVDELARGDEVDILGTSDNKRWLNVRVRKSGLHGWVYAVYVTIKVAAKPPRQEPFETVVKPWMLAPLSAWIMGGGALLIIALYWLAGR